VEIEYEDGGKKVKIVTTRSGTTRFINGMSEKAYNQQQQQKAAASTTPANKPSGTTGSGSSTPTTRTNSSTTQQRTIQSNTNSGNVSNAQVQAEQRMAQQRAQEERQRQIAMEQAQARYQQQVQELSERSQRQARTADALLGGLSSIFQGVIANQIKRSIQEDNANRRDRFKRLEDEVKTGNYDLAECDKCYGEGYKSCTICRSSGKTKCMSCSGNSGKTCSTCSGSGRVGGGMQLACWTCNGKGVKQCYTCGNQGEQPCSPCNATGRRVCVYCAGTGKVTKYASATRSSSTPNYQTSDNLNSSPSVNGENDRTGKEQVMKAVMEEGESFLKKNKAKPGVKTTASELQYQILKEGTGRRFKRGDTITYHVRYSDVKGKVLYDTYKDKQPARHAFSGFSMGLDFALEAFSMMPAGSRYKFFVPNQLAYKEREVLLTNGNIIQSGSALIVEYELLSVKRPVAEMLKEEKRIDSILVKLMNPQLVKSYNKVKEDSLFCITLSRSFEEEKRTELWVETAILYREADGYYPTDKYGSDIVYHINQSGSSYSIFYIASPTIYKNILIELEANAKSLGIKVVKEKKIIYENERPRKKLTGDEFWNKF
jgi:FKBP-type peptidyl-prolyl cis-trans isomerase